MAKFIHILAASVGSGLVLGASIRLAETLGSPSRKPQESAAPDWQAALAGVVARVDRQQTEVETIRHQVSRAVNALDSVGVAAADLRADLQRQLSEDLDQRLAAVEEKLHLSLKASSRETVNAMVASIESRVAPRISRLESDVTVQSAALAELRDCAQQSERSMQRLVTVMERVISGRAAEQGAPESPKLSVVTGRGQDEQGGGNGSVRRPA